MKMIQNSAGRMMAIGAFAFLAMALPAHGQSVLDQQLGDKQDNASKPADTAKPDAPAEKKPAPKSATPDMVSPRAAKSVDDMDLVNKLTGNDPNGGSDGDKMKQMIDRMGQSQSRLSDRDPGAVTQETQKRIITDLDVMIEMARKQQSQGKQSQGSKSQQGQKRQMSSGQQQGPSQQGGNQAATSSGPRRGSPEAPQSNGEDLHQKTPQEWGNLPARDRDLISNGASEQYLPSYKEMIDRYYQALAEIGKTKDK